MQRNPEIPQCEADREFCAVESDVLVEEFRETRDTYRAFTERLKALLEDLLDATNIRFHLIDGRTKTLDSLSDKVCRPGKAYSYHDSIDDITDLTGLRIIAYYLDDVDRIASLIKSEFDVDVRHSLDQRDVLEENEFGYLSIHFVVQLKELRATQMEWARFAGLRAEIQVRTVLQHAWAAISHALQYKSKRDIPKSLRRKLYRLCGIFELADEEFLSLKDAHNELRDEIESRIAQDSLDIEVSPESLARYIDHTGIDGTCMQMAEDLGWDIVPYCHGNRMEDYSDLCAICDLTRISSLRDFDSLTGQLESQAECYLSALAHASPGPWSVSPLFVIQMLILVHRGAHVQLDQLLQRADWDPETAATVLAVAQQENMSED